MNNKRITRFSLLILAALCSGTALAAEPIDTQSGGLFSHSTGVAILGYDPVAYFDDARPEKGSPQFVATWKGAKWLFASQARLDKFQADPAKYAPQYGGYCAYGVARDQLIEIDPNSWTILDGKLYLNYTADVQKKWQADEPGFIRQADAKFPGLLEKN